MCTTVSVLWCKKVLLKRQDTLKDNLSSFVLTDRPEKLAFYYGYQMKPRHWYDIGINIMTYWWNRKVYENEC